MGKIRTTTHRGREGYANHNEHLFLKNRKISGCSFVGKKGQTLEEKEMDFYRYHFGEQLAEQNERYIQKRQLSRTKTPEEFYKSPRYKPTEEILQVGNIDEHPDTDTYEKIIKEYYSWKRKWSEAHGGHLILLSYMNHFDEATPHTHGREVWQVYEDGIWKIHQEKAMEAAGIPLPDPTKPVGRFNNRGMTYTAMCRKQFQEICIRYGFDIETKSLPKRLKHKTVQEYQDAVNREYFENREKEISKREQALNLKEQELEQREREIQTEDLRLNRQRKEIIQNNEQSLRYLEKLKNADKAREILRKKNEEMQKQIDRAVSTANLARDESPQNEMDDASIARS